MSTGFDYSRICTESQTSCNMPNKWHFYQLEFHLFRVQPDVLVSAALEKVAKVVFQSHTASS